MGGAISSPRINFEALGRIPGLDMSLVPVNV